MLLYEITDAFDSVDIKYALVGGYALALHGIVRATVDVDIVLQLKESEFAKAESALNTIGLQSRLPVRSQDLIKMRKEYIKNRNLIAWSFVDFSNPSRMADILITKDLKELKVQKVSVGGRKISVATLEQLFKLKKEAGRPQDLVDLISIESKLNGKKV